MLEVVEVAGVHTALSGDLVEAEPQLLASVPDPFGKVARMGSVSSCAHCDLLVTGRRANSLPAATA